MDLCKAHFFIRLKCNGGSEPEIVSLKACVDGLI